MATFGGGAQFLDGGGFGAGGASVSDGRIEVDEASLASAVTTALAMSAAPRHRAAPATASTRGGGKSGFSVGVDDAAGAFLAAPAPAATFGFWRRAGCCLCGAAATRQPGRCNAGLLWPR